MLNVLQEERIELTRPAKGSQQAALLLSSIFNACEPLLKPGLRPALFKEKVLDLARKAQAAMHANNIAFCRNGFLHPDTNDNRPLEPGEAFTLDMWLALRGWHADLARIYTLPPCNPQTLQLKKAVYSVQNAVLQRLKAAAQLVELVEAAQQAAKQNSCFIVEEAFGHGIGRQLHQEPAIAFSYCGEHPFGRLKENLIVTIEPALTLQPAKLRRYSDGRIGVEAPLCLHAELMAQVTAGQPLILGR